MGQPIERKIYKGRQKTKRGIQQETKRYPTKKEKVQREQKKIRKAQEKERDLYWDPTRPMKKKRTTVEPPQKKIRKADVFQRVFEGIIQIIWEPWLKRNTDHHQPLQGQKQIARITEATQTVTNLYLLQSLIMSEHESKYFTVSLEKMLEQSVPKMLTWATW